LKGGGAGIGGNRPRDAGIVRNFQIDASEIGSRGW
jgi:hypothetical protein